MSRSKTSNYLTIVVKLNAETVATVTDEVTRTNLAAKWHSNDKSVLPFNFRNK